MNRLFCVLAILVCLFWVLAGHVYGDLARDVMTASQPLDEGVPEVAVVRLQQLAAKVGGGEEAGLLKAKLAEALIAAGRAAEALPLLDDASLRQQTSAIFLRAQALAALNRWPEALGAYDAVINTRPSPEQIPAIFGAAEALRALGRADEAIARYQLLGNDGRFGALVHLRTAELLIDRQEGERARHALDAAHPKAVVEKRQKRLLRARLHILTGHPEQAVSLLDSLAEKSEPVSHDTVVAALFALADAHLQLGTPEAGDDYLEHFITRHPGDPALVRIFAKLDQLYRAEHKPSRMELERWARETAQPRRGLARWHLAEMELRAGRRDEAIRQLEDVRRNPQPALAPALLDYARMLQESNREAEASMLLHEIAQLPLSAELRAKVEFETARAAYQTRDYVKAAGEFSRVASGSTEATQPAQFNAAVAWLQADQPARSEFAIDQLSARGDTTDASDVLLEKGLRAARENEASATKILQDFVRQFPQHPRLAEAQLALAELAFHAAPPQLEAADRFLAAARAARPTEQVREHIDYLAVWLADLRGPGDEGALDAANSFLRSHPSGELAPEVRLKLAETYFRRQDFANAQTQFELLAQETADAPLLEKALFLAAQSAMSTMTPHALDHALDLLAQVVKLNGDFRWAARIEQAAVERRLGKPRDAQLLYDEVLKGDARSGEKREALCGKADTLLELGAKDPGDLIKAVNTYDQLASTSPDQPHWRNQALFKKGVCLEKQAQPDAALATFYSILEFDPQPGKAPEYFWFYKAGFSAAQLLEEKEKWQSAAAIYDRLASAAGPRSEEAKTRLTQLRLEHFLW